MLSQSIVNEIDIVFFAHLPCPESSNAQAALLPSLIILWLFGGSLSVAVDYLAVRPVSRSEEPYGTCNPTSGGDNAELGHAAAFALADGKGTPDPLAVRLACKLAGDVPAAAVVDALVSRAKTAYKASQVADDLALLIRQAQDLH